MGVSFLQPKGVENLEHLGIDLKKGTGELCENSIEQGAHEILIGIIQKKDGRISYFLADNGIGMGHKTIPYALAFGGEKEEVREKNEAEVAKFHAGLTITSISFGEIGKIYSKKAGLDWYYSYLDVNTISGTNEVPDAKKKSLPSGVQYLIKEAELRGYFSFEKDSGTVFICDDLRSRIISPHSLQKDIEDLRYYIGEQYHSLLKASKVKISILVNHADEILVCEAIDPLLRDEKLLQRYGLENFAAYRYEKILSVRDIIPSSRTNAFLDIDISLTRKKNPKDRMMSAPRVIVLNQSNQGIYLERIWKIFERSLDIGFNRHNDFNGLRALIKFNGAFDEIIGIRLNKSEHQIMTEFLEVLEERLKPVMQHFRKMLKQGETNKPPAIKISARNLIEPIVLKHPLPVSSSSSTADPKPGSTLIPEFNPVMVPISAPNSNPHESNLVIFAAKEKPEISIEDLGNQDIKFLRNDDKYLLYDRPVNKGTGLTNIEVEKWWNENSFDGTYEERIKSSMVARKAPQQIRFYEIYKKYVQKRGAVVYPAILPEVYISFTTKLKRDSQRQCIDFLLVLPGGQKVIIEIDGIQHYSIKSKDTELWIPSEQKYAADRMFDRRMTLKGYKVFRFSNYEIRNSFCEEMLLNFFDELGIL